MAIGDTEYAVDVVALVRDVEGAVGMKGEPAGMPPVLKNSEATPSGVSRTMELLNQLTK